MALTDLQIMQATPRERDWKPSDGGGLCILARPNGAELWRMKYRQHGKEKRLAFGIYHQIGLREALPYSAYSVRSDAEALRWWLN